MLLHFHRASTIPFPKCKTSLSPPPSWRLCSRSSARARWFLRRNVVDAQWAGLHVAASIGGLKPERQTGRSSHIKGRASRAWDGIFTTRPRQSLAPHGGAAFLSGSRGGTPARCNSRPAPAHGGGFERLLRLAPLRRAPSLRVTGCALRDWVALARPSGSARPRWAVLAWAAGLTRCRGASSARLAWLVPPRRASRKGAFALCVSRFYPGAPQGNPQKDTPSHGQ